jgi:hypothetical protein
MNEVMETGERMCFSVASGRNPDKRWRVDLTALEGRIMCECPDWSCRRWPALRDGKEPLTNATLCRHGRAALMHFCRGLLSAMAQSETDPSHNS